MASSRRFVARDTGGQCVRRADTSGVICYVAYCCSHFDTLFNNIGRYLAEIGGEDCPGIAKMGGFLGAIGRKQPYRVRFLEFLFHL